MVKAKIYTDMHLDMHLTAPASNVRTVLFKVGYLIRFRDKYRGGYLCPHDTHAYPLRFAEHSIKPEMELGGQDTHLVNT